MAFADWDALLTTTFEDVTPHLEDNIFSNLPLWYFLNEAGHIKKVSGGAFIREPVMYAGNDTVGSYHGYDPIPTTPQEGISSATYEWAEFAGSIAISGREEAQNSSEEQIIDLLEAKVEQLELSLTEELDRLSFLDGTGNDGKDPLGLDVLVDATSTVGGIDRSAEAWWEAHVADAQPLHATAGIASLNTAYNSVTRGTYAPDFELTTQALFEVYESLLEPNLRYANTKVGDAGFQNLVHKGVPVVFDPYCQESTWYFLNSRNLYIKAHKDVWFKNTPFKENTNQNARYSQILLMYQLVTNNARFNAKLTNVDTTP